VALFNVSACTAVVTLSSSARGSSFVLNFIVVLAFSGKPGIRNSC
jgi:hypothetical protein